MIPTLASTLQPAQLCRANDWPPGTMLIGHSETPNLDPIILWITTVGHSLVLARCLDSFTKTFDRERSWYLSARNWTEILPNAWPHEVYTAHDHAIRRLSDG